MSVSAAASWALNWKPNSVSGRVGTTTIGRAGAGGCSIADTPSGHRMDGRTAKLTVVLSQSFHLRPSTRGSPVFTRPLLSTVVTVGDSKPKVLVL